MRSSEDIIAEISACLGWVPAFFIPAQETPHVLENLWQQTVSASINNTLPALFKEKLFAYLSRYCTVPYCIISHSCALLSLGMSARQVLQLLESPAPTREIEEHLKAIAASPPLTYLSRADSALEAAILSCCIYTFLNPHQDAGCRSEMRRILGLSNYNHLIAFLSYVNRARQG